MKISKRLSARSYFGTRQVKFGGNWVRRMNSSLKILRLPSSQGRRGCGSQPFPQILNFLSFLTQEYRFRLAACQLDLLKTTVERGGEISKVEAALLDLPPG